MRRLARRVFVPRWVAVVAFGMTATHGVIAQDPPAAAKVEPPMFAVEISTGSKWDPSKPAHEQEFFRDHSSNLKRLRDAGALVIGARYSDKGLVVLAAQDEASARAMMDEDPSIKAGVFKYQIHPFNVFYGGTVSPRVRRTTP
jgi:uncharacterized protein YciI